MCQHKSIIAKLLLLIFYTFVLTHKFRGWLNTRIIRNYQPKNKHSQQI